MSPRSAAVSDTLFLALGLRTGREVSVEVLQAIPGSFIKNPPDASGKIQNIPLSTFIFRFVLTHVLVRALVSRSFFRWLADDVLFD